MTRLSFWAALATTVAVIVGCGPTKELPDEIPKAPESTTPAPAVPKVSEPAAKAYIEKAVKAYTGGKPELVAKGIASRVTLKGKMSYSTGNQNMPVEATRMIAAVWPDRFHDVDELQVDSRRLAVEAWMHRPHLVTASGTIEENYSNTPREKTFAADVVAQHWMALFLPLTDPKAVVYELKTQLGTTPTGQPLSTETLKLALGEFSVFSLTFDATTHALLRVEYPATELGHTIHRTWTMLDHKPGPEGLSLPSKMQCRWDNDVKEEWEVLKWEFPTTIPDAEFQGPKR